MGDSLSHLDGLLADIYNQRGRRPSWLLSAHIRQVREE